ncbi:MAG TPA: HAD hydrolase-like protein [Bryobacteraceae bacterium]|nr:HAD hydrolase-like protein [Bryobacteraceae bacterium]
MESIIVFDMDGVLAEVTESYREAIVQTVEHFTGQRIARESIQSYKNAGGWNNDWALSQKIAADLGVEADYDTVAGYFNEIFIGPNRDGLIQRESWFPRPGLLERLMQRFGLAIFTGRLRYELDITLERFAPALPFDPIICAEHVSNAKPAPDGLLAIQSMKPGRKLWYVGDTVDDARAAGAAGVPFIGVLAKSHSHREELSELFRQEKAVAIIENINEIEACL